MLKRSAQALVLALILCLGYETPSYAKTVLEDHPKPPANSLKTRLDDISWEYIVAVGRYLERPNEENLAALNEIRRRYEFVRSIDQE